jgi:hypothetical protein
MSDSRGASNRGAYGAVSVSNASATLVVAAGAARRGVIVQNEGATDIALGTDNGVTLVNGLKLDAGESYEFTNYSGPVWAIAETAPCDVRFLGIG